MLSILIPVHNYDIRVLLRQLAHQCAQNHLVYEIICLDDASESKYQEYYNEIKKSLKLQWLTTAKNIGRSAARNTLVRQASYENLLFLDCDVTLPDEMFIQRYIPYLKQKTEQVIYGSCIYQPDKPSDQKLLLHWIYGSTKENPPLSKRIKHPYSTFHTVNFLTRKKILQKYPFDESISKYGHEDSLWACNLQKYHISIIHIDNPVLHTGIYPVKHFLRKTAQAIHNLIFLEKTKKDLSTNLNRSIRIIQLAGFEKIVFKIYRLFERRIVKNLFSDHPSLFLFSVYKLGLAIRFRRKH